MNTIKIELVKTSWALIAKMNRETVGGLFYNKLFEVMPEVKLMFSRTSIPEQSKKLLGMLSYIVSKLDKLDEILVEVAKLAKRHTQYGVRDEHYEAVGIALLWTLEKGLGAYWNDELEQAWTEVFTTLANAMMAVQHDGITQEMVLL